MDHSQVSIQTDAAQEADADVDVLIEQEATELTQPLPVTPIIVLKQDRSRLKVHVQYRCIAQNGSYRNLINW